MNINMPASTAIGTRGSSVKPGEVENVSVSRADNGFSVSIRYKQKPHRKNEMQDYEAGCENEVYEDIERMLTRIRKCFEGVKLEGKK